MTILNKHLILPEHLNNPLHRIPSKISDCQAFSLEGSVALAAGHLNTAKNFKFQISEKDGLTLSPLIVG